MWTKEKQRAYAATMRVGGIRYKKRPPRTEEQKAARRAKGLTEEQQARAKLAVIKHRSIHPRVDGDPNVKCSFDSCGKSSQFRGMCNGHYQQYRLGQTLRPLRGAFKASFTPEEWAERQKTVKKNGAKEFWKNNPGLRAAYLAHRRAIKFQQTCRCCTEVQIEELYGQATLVGGEVDHKIPLALGGHHCMKNLQALTYEDHREKTKSDVRYIAEARRRSKLLLQWPIAAAA